MKPRLGRGSFSLGVATSLSLLAARRPAAGAQFEFKCGSELSADHPSSIRLGQMWAEIEKDSGGRIHTQFFPNSALGAPAAVFGQLRVGAVQFDLISAGNLSAVVPSFDIVNLGFAFRDSDEALRVMDGPLGDYVRNDATTKNLHVMHHAWDVGMIQIGSAAHPVRSVDDLHGFKIRVSESKIALDLFRALGANPTPVPFNEIYTGLQTRIIDGEASPMLAIETMKFFEVQKYISMTNHAWGAEFLVANGDTWKSLPPDLQQLVERSHTKYAIMGRRDAKTASDSLRATLTRQGTQFNDVDQAPFRAALGSYYQNWSSVFRYYRMGFARVGTPPQAGLNARRETRADDPPTCIERAVHQEGWCSGAGGPRRGNARLGGDL